ncbi:hypothetical protein EZJ43_09390 [Pedobacter changchengzhani]|uniref:Uncharacterized protein n=1 Tax=Pedobacter changchengzhani TaxID=2529274 RepID=A0A4R5MKG1_9SPHI|nr:hypothetical protein [Pedobacter changchengzhani]TDG36207.1 hypothetical protein EZJ43_09390 [Pedobacter changchengzhani]
MENINNFTLIHGDFSVNDAKSLVLSFYNTKILFHNQQLSRIALGMPGDEKAIELKILALKKTREDIKLLLNDSNLENQFFEIDGHISIKKMSK